MYARESIPIPHYYRIREKLREQIASGQLNPGDRLGSERELAKQYGVSSITIKRAILDLVREGLLYRVAGKGTFVAQPKMERDLSRLTSFTEEMLHYGLKPNSKILAATIVPASGRMARNLDLAPGEKVIALERVRYAEGVPLMVEKTFLPDRLFPDLLSENLATQSLYHFITEKYGIALIRARETLEPVIINDTEADHLGVEAGALGLLLELIAYTEGEKPVEYTKAIVRGDRCKYYIEMAGFRRDGGRSRG